LSGGLTAVTLGEEDVIILVALERRVKIYKVNRFVFDIAAEYFQVIAVIQNVLCHIAPLFYSKGIALNVPVRKHYTAGCNDYKGNKNQKARFGVKKKNKPRPRGVGKNKPPPRGAGAKSKVKTPDNAGG
jgi:hypothetical protein